MNISVYLPDKLKTELDNYVQEKHTNKNAVIREALELLLKQEKKRTWGDWINHIEPDDQLPTIETLRKDLVPPKEVEL